MAAARVSGKNDVGFLAHWGQEVVGICDLVAKWLNSFHVDSTKHFQT